MDSSTEPPTKRIRKGTKSCIECRQRKIRCIYETETDPICAGCKARHRECVPQTYQRPSNASDLSRADRIGRLERQIASIAAAVQNNERVGSPFRNVDLSTAAEDTVADNSMEGPATTAPTHLRFLFDNSLIAPSGQHDAHQVPHPPCSSAYLEQARAKLQHLVPAKGDVLAAASYGTSWMRLHQSLFTAELPFASAEAMIDKYDDQLRPDAQLVDLACFLLVFAVTVRQVPPGEQRLVLRDVPKYVQDVLYAVENTIVSHTGIISTVEGLTATVLYMRLQLGFGQIRPLWLTLRRTIAIAELIGLPRTWTSNYIECQSTTQTTQNPKIAEKVALWEAICATDRLSSMMFNLPAATATHNFPTREILNSAGAPLSQPYLLELADIAMRVQELDESHTSGQPKSKVYGKVLTIDSDIHSLKSLTTRSWWDEGNADFTGDHLVQFWHFYLLVRTHVHSAMDSDEHDQYKYSRIACSEACQSLARRYGHVRQHLPPGFFICRIIDMQIFSAAIFLILSCYEQISAHNSHASSISPNEPQLAAVQHILKTMESVSGQVSSEFAREAAATIKSLMTLLENPAVANSQGLTLRIPLLGKIHIAARQQVPAEQQPSLSRHHAPLVNHSSQTDNHIPAITSEIRASVDSFNIPTDPFPWYMELDMGSSSLQDPFITDDFGNWDHYVGMGGINPSM